MRTAIEKKVLLFLIALLFSSCQVFQSQSGYRTQSRLSNQLMEKIHEWETSPQKQSEIRTLDAFNFVSTLYAETYGIILPTDTIALLQTGEEAPLTQLQTGDVLVFKTTPASFHVGIYLQNGEFVHHQSNGNISINQLYGVWEDNYWTSRRFFPSY